MLTTTAAMPLSVSIPALAPIQGREMAHGEDFCSDIVCGGSVVELA